MKYLHFLLFLVTGAVQVVNSTPPSAVYMRQRTGLALVQIMAWRLFGAKPLSRPVLGYVNWTLGNKLQSNFNQNTKLFIHENASENIDYETAAILSRGRWVEIPQQERQIPAYPTYWILWLLNTGISTHGMVLASFFLNILYKIDFVLFARWRTVPSMPILWYLVVKRCAFHWW